MFTVLTKAVLLVLLAALGGCAGLQVTYNSDPPGATLYEDGKPVGTTPHTLNYQPDDTFNNGGCLLLRATSVTWASGATASSSGLSACRSTGTSQVYTFVRPDVPGRDIDMNFALQLQRNRIMQNSNAIQLYQATTPAPRQPTNCRSWRAGNTIQTSCN